MRSRSGRIAVLAALMVSAVVPCAEATKPRRVPLTGHWANPAPCVFTEYNPLAGDFVCTGSSVWHGSFSGVTTFEARGKMDLVTGDMDGTVKETFVGTAEDGTRGTLEFHETFTIRASEIRIEADIVRGTRGFEGSRGHMTFTGLYPVVGGAGDYTGEWRRRSHR